MISLVNISHNIKHSLKNNDFLIVRMVYYLWDEGFNTKLVMTQLHDFKTYLYLKKIRQKL